jgi:hypothetical protein
MTYHNHYTLDSIPETGIRESLNIVNKKSKTSQKAQAHINPKILAKAFYLKMLFIAVLEKNSQLAKLINIFSNLTTYHIGLKIRPTPNNCTTFTFQFIEVTYTTSYCLGIIHSLIHGMNPFLYF